jgi:hypothetical protein
MRGRELLLSQGSRQLDTHPNTSHITPRESLPSYPRWCREVKAGGTLKIRYFKPLRPDMFSASALTLHKPTGVMAADLSPKSESRIVFKVSADVLKSMG